MSQGRWVERQYLMGLLWVLAGKHGVRAIEAWRLHHLFPDFIREFGCGDSEALRPGTTGEYALLSQILLEETDMGLIVYDGFMIYLPNRATALEQIGRLRSTDELPAIESATRAFVWAYDRSFPEAA